MKSILDFSCLQKKTFSKDLKLYTKLRPFVYEAQRSSSSLSTFQLSFYDFLVVIIFPTRSS